MPPSQKGNPPPAQGPRRRTKSAANIVHELEMAIGNREYLPGERLTELMLADKFKVSRGPVREALRTLAGRGLITIDRNRGAVVTRITETEAIAASEIHGVLMGLAARRACTNSTPAMLEDFERLTASLLKTARRRDESVPDDFLRGASECVRKLGQMSGSEMLYQMMMNLLTREARLRNRYSLEKSTERVRRASSWVKLSRLIKRGVATDAEAAARHIQEMALAASRIKVPASRKHLDYA